MKGLAKARETLIAAFIGSLAPLNVISFQKLIIVGERPKSASINSPDKSSPSRDPGSPMGVLGTYGGPRQSDFLQSSERVFIGSDFDMEGTQRCIVGESPEKIGEILPISISEISQNMDTLKSEEYLRGSCKEGSFGVEMGSPADRNNIFGYEQPYAEGRGIGSPLTPNLRMNWDQNTINHPSMNN